MSSILFISMMNGAAWGGSEELWYAAAKEAVKNGHKVSCAVYHWSSKESRMEQLKNAGCDIFYFPNKGVQKKNLIDKLQYKITRKFTIRKYLKVLAVEDYDLVILNQGYFEVTTSVWSGFYKRLDKYVLLFHNYSENELIKPSKARILSNWIRKARINLFASERIKLVLEDRLGMEIPNGDVLVNPISFQPPGDITPFPPLYEGNFRMVMLAALDVDRKAQDQLIMALSSKRWRDANWTLHLYGEGRDEKMLRKLIQKLGMQDKVFLEGHADDVRKVLSEAHIVFQVTHIDAMPLSVVEALAMSRAVVASKIGDMPQWVVFNENGWICHNAKAAEIDRIMHLVWAGRDSWEEMGKRSYRIFRDKFPPSPMEYFFQQIGLDQKPLTTS